MLIPLSEVRIPAYRMRREFDPKRIEELAVSISAIGLIQPIVLRAEHAGEEPGMYLVAGERRLRALQSLNHLNVSYTRLESLSPETALQIELDENTVRTDLSWQEVSAARAYIFERKRQLAIANGEAPQTVTAYVADLTGSPNATSVHESIKLAAFLNDPDVAGAKSIAEAKKILERKQRAILTEELNSRLGSVQSIHTLKNVDMLEGIAFVADSSIDIILTDPPYGIDMDTMPTQSGSSSGNVHTYKDDEDYATSIVASIASNGFRVCKSNAHAFMFCDGRMFAKWAAAFTVSGWYVWPHPIIWNKMGTGSLLGAANGPRHCYESILYAQKGMKICRVLPDVITAPAGDPKLHPANKSPEILEALLSLSAVSGDTIFDPCCGSAGIFRAAEKFNCRVLAFEKDPVHYQTALNALNQGEVK